MTELDQKEPVLVRVPVHRSALLWRTQIRPGLPRAGCSGSGADLWVGGGISHLFFLPAG